MNKLSLLQKIILIITAGFFFDLGVAVYLYFPKDYEAPQYKAISDQETPVSRQSVNNYLCTVYQKHQGSPTASCIKQ